MDVMDNKFVVNHGDISFVDSKELLPAAMAEAFLVLRNEGITDERVTAFVESAADVEVSVENQDGVLLAEKLVHLVSGTQSDAKKRLYFIKLKQANPKLAKFHDARHPRYKGRYING